MRWISAFILIIAVGYGGLFFTPLSMKTATWRLRMTMTHWRMIFGLCIGAEKLGLGPFYHHMRTLVRPLMRLRLSNVSDVQVTHSELAGVRVVIYHSPKTKLSDASRPGLLYFHGGGWVLGAPEIFQKFYQELVRRMDLVVVAIDYEKAPEHLYPKSFDTCLKAVITLSKEASRFGIDPKRLAVGGDSAGGNLATAVVTHLHRGGVPGESTRVAQLVLIYPVLQGLDFRLPSYIENANEEMLSRSLMIRFWQLYLLGSEPYTQQMIANNHSSPNTRQRAKDMIWKYLPNNPQPPKIDGDGDPEAIQALQSATSDALTSPLLFPDSDLKKLPPVYIVSCEYDVLRDEALAFALRLHGMKHPVTHEHYLAYHGFLSFYDFGITEAKILVDEMAIYLKKHL